MMNTPQCPGCGTPFQTEHISERGYVPRHILEQNKPGLVCRRCFQIRHYGRADQVQLSTQTVLDAVARGVAASQAVFYLVDPFDFEGTWRPEWLPLLDRKPYYLVVNKIDLLPAVAKEEELMSWVAGRVRSSQPVPRAILTAGSRRAADRRDIETLLESREIRSVALMGATNVGKSSLLGVLSEGMTPTVSHFPGTTQQLVTVQSPGGIKWADTPGLAPGDRLTDVLCPACGATLTPTSRLQAKLYHLDPGQAVMFSGFASFELISGESRTFLCYAGSGVLFHRTSGDKARSMAGQSKEWLGPPCPDCSGRITRWDCHELTVPEGHDIAVAGLGWISIRGGTVRVRIQVPEGIMVRERPGLFGRRTASNTAFHRKVSAFGRIRSGKGFIRGERKK